MRPRDPEEQGRSASPLELFFDLVIVIAVATAAVELHHALTENHIVDGLLSYMLVFFAIWWAWMNFTWFATSFDTDDWLYRVLTVEMKRFDMQPGTVPSYLSTDIVSSA